MRADYTDDFHVVRRTIFRRLGVTNMLADRVLVWEKFLRHFFIEDGNATPVFVFAFGLREIAAPQQLDSDGVEVSLGNRRVERGRAGIWRFRIGR